MPLDTFHPAVSDWFKKSFDEPTAVQNQSWPAIAQGEHTLLAAPTGSGKTPAAFLASIDALVREGLERGLPDETRVLYISPLKALSNDIQKNLQVPLAGIRDCLLEREAHHATAAEPLHAVAILKDLGRALRSFRERDHEAARAQEPLGVLPAGAHASEPREHGLHERKRHQPVRDQEAGPLAARVLPLESMGQHETVVRKQPRAASGPASWSRTG